MPDLTVHVAVTCASNVAWQTAVASSSRADRSYVVAWTRTPGGEAEYDWTCECVGFRHRGRCRHILEVADSGARCGWNGELDPTLTPTADGECPSCGGPVERIRVAV